MPDLMPIVDDEAPRRSAAGGPGWRVLVVDDEPCLRDVHRRLLGKLGVEVLIAASGAEAQRLIRSEPVDLVISDVKMPGELDGIMLFEWLAMERPQLAERFIFVTGDPHNLVHPSLGEGRPSRLLTKPFLTQHYLAQVSALARRDPRGTGKGVPSLESSIPISEVPVAFLNHQNSTACACGA